MKPIYRKYKLHVVVMVKLQTKYSGMDASLMKRMKELEDENRRLKKMYAEERLKLEIAKYASDSFFRTNYWMARKTFSDSMWQWAWIH